MDVNWNILPQFLLFSFLCEQDPAREISAEREIITERSLFVAVAAGRATDFVLPRQTSRSCGNADRKRMPVCAIRSQLAFSLSLSLFLIHSLLRQAWFLSAWSVK